MVSGNILLGFPQAFILTLYFAMSQNGQTHFKNLSAFAARFLKCVRLFYDIAK